MKRNLLKPCPYCENQVEIRWKAGLSKAIREALDDKISKAADGRPCWYISCDRCGFTLLGKTKYPTYDCQQKTKEKTIKAWNGIHAYINSLCGLEEK